MNSSKLAAVELKLIAINPNQAERLDLIDEFLTLWEIRGKSEDPPAPWLRKEE